MHTILTTSSSDRSRMKKNTLINLLFIRGNAWILRQLMEEQAAERKQAER